MNTAKLKSGYTTGACAAAAAGAAAYLLAGRPAPATITIALPEGGVATLPIAYCKGDSRAATAAVVKDAGDDPDITHGATIEVTLRVLAAGDIMFAAGPGVGRITKPGLALPPGEPAINPGPRQMISAAIRAVTALPVAVTVSIPGGEIMAARTFNPRLGVAGGLSILGTTGIVRPFSMQAIRETIRCALSVAAAAGITDVILTPGNLGRRAAQRHCRPAPDQVVEVSNEWGFAVDALRAYPFRAMLAIGHPGKLAKLANGEWDTHSARSGSALPVVRSWLALEQAHRAPDAATVEALFAALPPAQAAAAANRGAESIRLAIVQRTEQRLEVAVMLTDLAGNVLGRAGDNYFRKNRNA